VNDPAFVCGFERRGDLLRDGDGLVGGNGAPREALREGLSIYELEDQREVTIRFFDAIDGRDVWMVERGEQLRFALESGKAVSVRRECIR
jgi:hypothetical protein